MIDEEKKVEVDLISSRRLYKLHVHFTPYGQTKFNDSPEMELYSNYRDDLENLLTVFQEMDKNEKIVDSHQIIQIGCMTITDYETPPRKEKIPRVLHARNRR